MLNGLRSWGEIVARVKWRFAAFEEIRRLPRVRAALKAEADAVRSQLGSGYVSDVGPGATRARASVVTGNGKAIRDNSRNNSLLKALNSRGR